MQKDFDVWNSQKKNIHLNGETRYYRQREIWWCQLGINIGFEQDGRGDNYERPVLILKGFSRHVCLIVPLTSSKKKNRYHVSLGLIQGIEAFVIISQLRLVDTRRFINRLAILENAVFEDIRKAVRNMI